LEGKKKLAVDAGNVGNISISNQAFLDSTSDALLEHHDLGTPGWKGNIHAF